ncbi:MAG: PIN domain-containing protein [Gemmatimonadaceae bacterium]
MGLLIDSTAFIHAERQRLTAAEFIEEVMTRWGDIELALSVMSAAELLHGVWRAEGPVRRARREEFVEALLVALPVVPITLTTARLFAERDARLAARGARIPTSDMLIACSALARGDDVLTGDPRHFRRVRELTVRTLK